MHIAFRHPQKMARLISGHRDRQRIAVRNADIFAGKPNQPSCDVKGIFSAFQHTAHPVDCRIRVTVSHGLVKRGYQVIMFFAGFVIQKRFFVETLGQPFIGYPNTAIRRNLPVQHYHFQRV